MESGELNANDEKVTTDTYYFAVFDLKVLGLRWNNMEIYNFAWNIQKFLQNKISRVFPPFHFENKHLCFKILSDSLTVMNSNCYLVSFGK